MTETPTTGPPLSASGSTPRIDETPVPGTSGHPRDSGPSTALAALIARRIRRTREAEGLKLVDLAAALVEGPMVVPLTANQLSKIESGKRDLSILELAAIALALDVDPVYFIRPGALCPTCGQETPA